MVAFIEEDGTVTIIEVEEGDLEGDLSMKVNPKVAFRRSIECKKDRETIHRDSKYWNIQRVQAEKNAMRERREMPAGIYPPGRWYDEKALQPIAEETKQDRE